jgi:hypothetical protein
VWLLLSGREIVITRCALENVDKVILGPGMDYSRKSRRRQEIENAGQDSYSLASMIVKARRTQASTQTVD